jgi:NAD-dependent deacetylase
VSNEIAALSDRIRSARRIAILTGAGVSAASGVPTFRDKGGLWSEYRPEDLATPDAFRRDPLLCWKWYAWRREIIARCAPNAAHRVIARWSRELTDCRVITQNVDDLHLVAGTRDVVRLHGSIWELSCTRARCAGTWRDERVPFEEMPPRCAQCGGLARPAVVWFGESLPGAALDAAVDAAECDVFLTIGTSAVVYPAAGFVDLARTRGAFTAEINLDETPTSSIVDVTIRGRAEEILPLI